MNKIIVSSWLTNAVNWMQRLLFKNTAYYAVPEIRDSYNEPDKLRALLRVLEPVTNKHRFGPTQKVATIDLWYILVTLKAVLGIFTFNNEVALKHFDVGFVLVATPFLTDKDTVKALNVLKNLLVGNKADAATIKVCIYRICMLNRRMNDIGKTSIVELSQISPNMHLV